MAGSNTGYNSVLDSWGETAEPSTRCAQSTLAEAVREDWDDDEDDGDDMEAPQKLWEEANRRTPMPELVIAGSSTSGSGVASPPPAAFQPALRILKRPSATSPSPTQTSSNIAEASNSYSDRESRYQAARERIFGDSSPSSSAPQKGAADGPSESSSLPIQIARAPKGPPVPSSSDGQNENGVSGGFGSRRGKKG